MKRVTLFCSSSDNISPMYFSEAEIIAKGLARSNFEMVYGGACVGLMGHIADKVLAHGGHVKGVIPEYLNKEGIVHKGLTELLVVDNLLDRKRAMLTGSDIAIAFPGGVGTIDEITEVISLKQLGEYKGKIFFVNFLDSWTPLIEFFTELKIRGMISQPLDQLYKSFESSQDLIEYLAE